MIENDKFENQIFVNHLIIKKNRLDKIHYIYDRGVESRGRYGKKNRESASQETCFYITGKTLDIDRTSICKCYKNKKTYCGRFYLEI